MGLSALWAAYLKSVATAAVTMATVLLMMSLRWSSASARAVAERFASTLHRTYRKALISVAPPARSSVDVLKSSAARHWQTNLGLSKRDMLKHRNTHRACEQSSLAYSQHCFDATNLQAKQVRRLLVLKIRTENAVHHPIHANLRQNPCMPTEQIAMSRVDTCTDTVRARKKQTHGMFLCSQQT